MKIFFPAFLVLFSVFLSGQQKKSEKILWEENKLLTWGDFKGKTEDISGKDVAAMSFCGIQYNNCINKGTKEYTYQANSFFVPVLSWVKVKSETILQHEQLHFDIAELYTRKLRKAFSEVRISPQNSQSQIYNPIFKEYQKVQNQYDTETHHGILQETNLQWKEKIHAELKELEAYKEERCY